MRELKFKVWDVSGKKIIFPLRSNQLIFTNNDWIVYDKENNQTFKSKNILMQYTGIKDNTSWDNIEKKNRNRITEYVYSKLDKLGKKYEDNIIMRNWEGIELYESDIVMSTTLNIKLFIKHIGENYCLTDGNKDFSFKEARPIYMIGNLSQTPSIWEKKE